MRGQVKNAVKYFMLSHFAWIFTSGIFNTVFSR